MKKKMTILIVVFALWTNLGSHAADLVCDPQERVASYDVIVNGNIEDVDYPAQPDGSIVYNVDFWMDKGVVTFILIAKDISGWAGPPSNPFDAKRPGVVTGARIIN